MRQTILSLLLSVASVFGNPPWPGIAYTEVRAFAWNPQTTKSEQLIRADMSFEGGVMNEDGVLLNAQQVKRLLVAQARRFRVRPVAGCYHPHNAFVFYNAEKKPVAFLEICFDCFGSRTSPADEKCDPDFLALATICAELQVPFGKSKTVDEFAKEFRTIFGSNAQTIPKSK